jgi:isocitrate/isopropylmalate dehydrogenase
MALDHGLPESGLGETIDRAVEDVLVAGFRTQDFFSGPPQRLVGTREMTDRILERLGNRRAGSA